MKLKNVLSTMAMLFVVIMIGCKKDSETGTNPLVVSTNPIDKSSGVAINSKISATFSEAMNPAMMTTSVFTVKQGTTVVVGSVTYTGLTATFTPTANLTANTIYTANINTSAKNMNGKTMMKDCNWSFTTGSDADSTMPSVVVTDPVNNAAGVPRNKVISITFSEPMNPASINESTFILKQGSSVIPCVISYSGSTVSFTPSIILSSTTNYTATLTTGAMDNTGNALAANKEWNFTTGGTTSALTAVGLGEALNYVILAKTAINNISTSAITGDLGLSPAATSYITGFALTNATGYATAAQITGKVYAADMADPTPINLTTAINNMITAYTDAAGRPSPDYTELGTGNIGGKTLSPGLYKWSSSVTLPTDVTISGNATDVWIFQIAGDLTLSSAVKITLIGGAQAKNIFWQVAGQATLGTTSHFEGILMSKTGITLQTGASMNGRALAQTAVVLNGNTVAKP